MAIALHRFATKARLDRSQVLDSHDPTEPTAALLATSAHCLAEGGFVRSRVVEHLDHFEVDPAIERKDPVAGSESGVQAAVDELRAQLLRKSLGRCIEAVGTCGERQVIQSHEVILTAARFAADTGVDQVAAGNLSGISGVADEAGAEVFGAEAGEHVVRRLAEEFDEFGRVGHIDRFGAHMCVGVA